MDMIQGKTAALISAAAAMGALAANADQQTVTHYLEFGRNLGLAFQIEDDILDIWGAPGLTGKEAAVDIVQRKKSIPVLYGLERSEKLRDFYASPDAFDTQNVDAIIKELEAVGARDFAIDQAGKYSQLTTHHLEAADPNPSYGPALIELVEQLLHRER
jgi:geranylgeranyl diphosphate synthase type I